MVKSLTAKFLVFDANALDPEAVSRPLHIGKAATFRELIVVGSGEFAGFTYEGDAFRIKKSRRPPGAMSASSEAAQLFTADVPGFHFTLSRGEKNGTEGWVITKAYALDDAWDSASRLHSFRTPKPIPDDLPCLLIRTIAADLTTASQLREQAINIAAAWIAS